MLGEVTSPGHTIAGSAGAAISSAKNEIRRRITQLTLLLEAYKQRHGRFTDQEELATDYEFVMSNLPLIENNREEFKALAEILGAPYLWKNDSEKTDFMHLLDTDIMTDLMKQLKAVYQYSLLKSILWTLPVSLLIGLMPYILNAAGNDVLMGEKFIAAIFASAPLVTVLTSMNHSFISIFDDFIQYRLSAVEVFCRDIPQMTSSGLGWYFQDPWIIAIGQVVPSAVTAILGSKLIYNELGKSQTSLPLNNTQKKAISDKIYKNVVGVAAGAGFRILVPIALGLLKEHIAILAYNVFYFLVWGFLGLMREYAKTYNYGRGLHGYDGYEEVLEKCLTYTNMAFSFLLALIAFTLKNNIIPWINDPSTPESIEANNFVSDWWALGCVILALLGPTYVQQDKIGNAYDQRWTLAAITLLPALIGFSLPTYWLGGEAMLVGLMLGWLASEFISMAYGMCSEQFRGPTPQVLQARRQEHTTQNPLIIRLLSEEEDGQFPARELEMSDRSEHRGRARLNNHDSESPDQKPYHSDDEFLPGTVSGLDRRNMRTTSTTEAGRAPTQRTAFTQIHSRRDAHTLYNPPNLPTRGEAKENGAPIGTSHHLYITIPQTMDGHESPPP
jgi:hypothetical protein